MVTDLTLVNNENKTLFDYGEEQYIIPLYQRDFAWGSEKNSNRENEILQLIDDIMDASLEKKNNYYLGSLIVFKRPGQDIFYEVIDGQQRLTALYLLFSCLNFSINKHLTYDCRPKSDNTLKKINDLMHNADSFDFEYNSNIYNGIKTIQRKLEVELKNNPQYAEEMKNAFKQVHLFRIEVPQCTDLNRYFEIMNTRGEQLEQHDIVKSTLMAKLDSSEKREFFAEIWNACSDMNGYIQMHLNPLRRKQLFGENWNEYPLEERLSHIEKEGSKDENLLSIKKIIETDFSVSHIENISDNDEHIRFESIIDFPHFLLHVLKIFVHCEKISNSKPNDKLLNDLLDDKKLIWSFDQVWNLGVVNGEKISQQANDYTWKFINYLLRSRFLFDKYIIKREYKKTNLEGEWCLKEMPNYSLTNFRAYKEWTTTSECRNHYNKMIQACLRVSYTSPKNMHWITEFLKWIFENPNSMTEYHLFAKNYVAKTVKVFVDSEEYQNGINTPHIVFNFLDLLLWEQLPEFHNSFNFEFRNSIEHWYPQNPTDKEGCPRWNDEDGHGTVDRFGNLALLPQSINSRFSNQSPLGKTGYESIISKGSLKLRLMNKLTMGKTSEEWRTKYCEEHEIAMLKLLKTACSDIRK